MTLDRFYPIFDSSDWLRRLLPLGVKLVQLRVKNLGEDATRREIRTAKVLCRDAGCQLIVNDYWQVAIEEGCDFVHLGQEDLDGADLGAIRRAGMRLGISTHDDAELERALACDPDYVALGPVYPTLLKKMKWAPQGLEKIGEWKRRVGDLPLVAIGGLTVERAAGVRAAGADIASVVTDITLSADPEARTRAWIAATRPTPIVRASL
jgi:thiamine-phosphate pyrophosphorylase